MKKQTLGLLSLSTLLILAGCTAPAVQGGQELPATDPQVTAESSPEDSLAPEASGSPAPSDEAESPNGLVTENPTDVELALMALMGPDGEFAAAASYEAVLEKYGDVEPYATIYQAELRHADALIRQLVRLGAEVPTNPYTGEIEAPSSLKDAATAWAIGEVANVELYDYLISQTDDPQLIRVFENLRAASADKHLPAFEAAAENGGTLDDMTAFSH
jgi:hypothetical protein